MSKKILYSSIGVIVLVLLVVISSNKPSVEVSQEVNPTTKSSIVSQLDEQNVVSILTASSNYYAQLFVNAKSSISSNQSANVFRTDNCIKNDPGANAINTYKEISNMYYVAKIDSPSGLDNWNYDANTTATDICILAGDAVNLKTENIPSTKLKIGKDLAAMKADMENIKTSFSTTPQ